MPVEMEESVASRARSSRNIDQWSTNRINFIWTLERSQRFMPTKQRLNEEKGKVNMAGKLSGVSPALPSSPSPAWQILKTCVFRAVCVPNIGVWSLVPEIAQQPSIWWYCVCLFWHISGLPAGMTPDTCLTQNALLEDTVRQRKTHSCLGQKITTENNDRYAKSREEKLEWELFWVIRAFESTYIYQWI